MVSINKQKKKVRDKIPAHPTPEMAECQSVKKGKRKRQGVVAVWS